MVKTSQRQRVKERRDGGGGEIWGWPVGGERRHGWGMMRGKFGNNGAKLEDEKETFSSLPPFLFHPLDNGSA